MNTLVVVSSRPGQLLNKFEKYFELWPFVTLGILPCQQNISTTVGARALKLDELIDYDEYMT